VLEDRDENVAMLVHLRIVSPSDRTDRALAVVSGGGAAANVAVLRGASLAPVGDLILCDVAREGVNDVVSGLRELDLHHLGSIAIADIDVSVSDAAAAAERNVRGSGSEAAVWEEVDARVRDESELTISFLVFLVVAGLIAAVGLIEDSPVLIVGAMVVGPEFGPIAGLSVGLYKRRATRIRLALRTLLVGVIVGVTAVALATMAGERLGVVASGWSASIQPLTGFVVKPSALAFTVALLAGVVGTLSLTQAKAGALIGVLISVTTIPAVAAIGVSIALGEWDDAAGATGQLALNVLGLVLAAVVTLWVQRAAWDRILPKTTREMRGRHSAP
jgi:uncharacterized hydrophobic protein (TIGR00271 family)